MVNKNYFTSQDASIELPILKKILLNSSGWALIFTRQISDVFQELLTISQEGSRAPCHHGIGKNAQTEAWAETYRRKVSS